MHITSHLQRRARDLRRGVSRHAAPGAAREQAVADARAHAAGTAAPLLRRGLWEGVAGWERGRVEN